MLIPVLMSLVGAGFVAAIGWLAGYDTGYRQARRDMRRVG